MKKQLTRLFACLLALAMAFAASACKLNDEAKPAETASANLEDDAVAVSIGDGKYTVTRGEVRDMYDNMVMQYSYMGMATPTADADIESLQDMAAEMLASAKVLQYQAELMGVTLDSEALSGVEADTEDEMAGLTADFRAQAVSEGAEDPDARAVEIFNERLAAAGLDMDVDGYRAYVRDAIEEQAVSAALEEKIKSAVAATDEEAKAYYDNLLATQKEAYEATPGDYLEDQEAYEKFGGDPILVAPEGYVRVRTITIVPEEALPEEYTTLTGDMETLAAEYGTLMLTDAAKSAARLSEIKTEYADKKKQADALYETYAAGAREKAAEAHQALVDGKSFTDALKTYSQDEVYTTYPSFVNTGLIMQKGVASSTWPQALVDAVSKLKAGEYSDVIAANDAFYIVELVGDEPAGETPYGDVEEEMLRLAGDSAAETLWQEKQEEWVGDSTVVTYHEDAYRDIGKVA